MGENCTETVRSRPIQTNRPGSVSQGAGSVMIAWLGFYLVMGTLSLFAHMAARAQVNVRF